MHEEFAPDFLSEDFLQNDEPEEAEGEAEVDAEEEEEVADIEEEML